MEDLLDNWQTVQETSSFQKIFTRQTCRPHLLEKYFTVMWFQLAFGQCCKEATTYCPFCRCTWHFLSKHGWWYTYPWPQNIACSEPGRPLLNVCHHGLCIRVDVGICNRETHVWINTVFWWIWEYCKSIPIKPWSK